MVQADPSESPEKSSEKMVCALEDGVSVGAPGRAHLARRLRRRGGRRRARPGARRSAAGLRWRWRRAAAARARRGGRSSARVPPPVTAPAGRAGPAGRADADRQRWPAAAEADHLGTSCGHSPWRFIPQHPLCLQVHQRGGAMSCGVASQWVYKVTHMRSLFPGRPDRRQALLHQHR